MDPHPEGMREQPDVITIDLSHPFRMRNSFGTVPGVGAQRNPLATISNPFGVKGYISIPERCHFVRLIAIHLLHLFFKNHQGREGINTNSQSRSLQERSDCAARVEYRFFNRRYATGSVLYRFPALKACHYPTFLRLCTLVWQMLYRFDFGALRNEDFVRSISYLVTLSPLGSPKIPVSEKVWVMTRP
jgi:hypothetical protein